LGIILGKVLSALPYLDGVGSMGSKVKIPLRLMVGIETDNDFSGFASLRAGRQH